MTDLDNRPLISPTMLQKPSVTDDSEHKSLKMEYYDVLSTMIQEQSEHLLFSSSSSNNKFNESYLKYREVVIAWMIDVCDYFDLHIVTQHMSVAYLDRLQPNEKFTRFEWQILAIACIIIASKYNEMEEHVPGLKKIEEITQQEIPNETFLYYELWTLKKMGWKLNARVPSAFLTAQIELGLLDNESDSMIVKDSSSTSLPSLLSSSDTPASTSSLSLSSSSYSRNNKTSRAKRTFFASSPLTSPSLNNNGNKKRSIKRLMNISEEMKGNMKEMMMILSTKCTLNLSFKPLPASAIATAIIFYVRKQFSIVPLWNDWMTTLTFHDPKTSKSFLKALQLILDMESAATNNENSNNSKENSYNISGITASNYILDLEYCDENDGETNSEDDDEEVAEEDEEESDLVRALQQALGMNHPMTTPLKESKSAENIMLSPMITPFMENKSSKPLLDELSPVAVNEIID